MEGAIYIHLDVYIELDVRYETRNNNLSYSKSQTIVVWPGAQGADPVHVPERAKSPEARQQNAEKAHRARSARDAS